MESLPYRATVFLRQTDVHTMNCGGGRSAEFAGELRHDAAGAARQNLQVGRCGSLDLMERSFALESDAVQWCSVMTEAEPQATGAWFVTVSRGGRMLRITREAALDGALSEGIGGAVVDLVNVLAAAGLRNDPVLNPVPAGLAAVGSA